eukprot:363874-Chlamydomonas_euryale.AAC.5
MPLCAQRASSTRLPPPPAAIHIPCPRGCCSGTTAVLFCHVPHQHVLTTRDVTQHPHAGDARRGTKFTC